MGNGAALRRWMIAVGIYFLLLGIRLLPWINGPMVEALGFHESVYTGGGLEPGTALFSFVLDWMATFGMTLVPLGAIMLLAARDPVRNRLMAHLALWHEALVGIGVDLWLVTRDYSSAAFYLAFIAVHLTVIVTGIRALRLAPARALTPAPTADPARPAPPQTARAAGSSGP